MMVTEQLAHNRCPLTTHATTAPSPTLQVDVVLHVFVAVGLMHHHFKVGLKLSHCLIHKAEHWALVLAAVSTAAAAIAEVVAAESPQSGHRGSDGATVHTLA